MNPRSTSPPATRSATCAVLPISSETLISGASAASKCSHRGTRYSATVRLAASRSWEVRSARSADVPAKRVRTSPRTTAAHSTVAMPAGVRRAPVWRPFQEGHLQEPLERPQPHAGRWLGHPVGDGCGVDRPQLAHTYQQVKRGQIRARLWQGHKPTLEGAIPGQIRARLWQGHKPTLEGAIPRHRPAVSSGWPNGRAPTSPAAPSRPDVTVCRSRPVGPGWSGRP